MILATIFITAINLAAAAFFIRRGWVNRPRQVSGQVIPFPQRGISASRLRSAIQR